MRSGGLFAGYGGLDMAVAEVFGAEPAWFSEIEPGPSKILAHHWPDVPNHGDITTVDWDAVEPVEIVSAGFPCQDVSPAGKRAGLKPGTRSGLWNYAAYAVSKLRPRYVVIENVRGLLSAEAHSDVEPCPWCLGEGTGEPDLRALGAVLGDLADLGYDAQWCGLRAADVGAPHGRYRIFILAADARRERRGSRGALPGCTGERNTSSEHQRLASTAADAADLGHERSRQSRNRWPGLEDSGNSAAPERGGSSVAWGQYSGAIRRWERTLGRPAPAPTEPGAKGGQRLAPRFVEWMQGLSAGHVTDVPGVNRNAQLKALGNGVVPQQAIAALHHMHHNHLLQASA